MPVLLEQRHAQATREEQERQRGVSVGLHRAKTEVKSKLEAPFTFSKKPKVDYTRISVEFLRPLKHYYAMRIVKRTVVSISQSDYGIHVPAHVCTCVYV